jgi:hypothetical protein
MRERFEELLQPIVEVLAELDPSDPDAAARLSRRFPMDSPVMSELATLFEQGVSEGWLCQRQGAPGIRYSRVRKASGADAMSVEAVRMECPGPGHTHPKGEFDLCFAASGEPTFDGRPPGWTVYAPGSWHVPSVTGGVMNILYFLPAGAIEFGPRPG